MKIMRTLKAEYEDLLEAWIDDFQTCTCNASPRHSCASCSHVGNPNNLLKNDKAWYNDERGYYSEEDVQSYV